MDSSRSKYLYRIIGGICILSILFLALLNSRINSAVTSFSSSIKSLVGDPRIDHIYFSFTEVDSLEDMGANGDIAWEELLGGNPKSGFLIVQKNETSVQPWGISMFHSLHCLKMIRDAMATKGRQESEKTEQMKEHDTHGMEHMGHCFAYLAQSLFCGADDTIEPPFETKNAKGEVTQVGVDGMAYVHQCRDAQPIFDIATQSQESPIQPWGWKSGDTIKSIFGNVKGR